MKPAHNLERRDKARLPYVCPIIVNDLMSGETCSARMFNHSDKGIYFESDALLEPGTEVYIGLCHPPSEDRPSDYTCHRTTIMWRKELGLDAHFYYGYGTQALPPVEGGGKLRQLAATNCDTGSISDPLSIFLSIENLCFSASSSDWQRRRFFLPPGLAQTVALPVGLYDVTPVCQAV
jgi:hypothetical protein